MWTVEEWGRLLLAVEYKDEKAVRKFVDKYGKDIERLSKEMEDKATRKAARGEAQKR